MKMYARRAEDHAGLRQWHQPLRNSIGERGPFDQRHHERADAVVRFETVDGRDIAR
jgi:hypothetical protein